VVTSRVVTLVSRPEGFPKESDFAFEEVDVGEAGPGDVLVKSLYVSVDPYQRGRMSTARSYAQGLELGDVITSQTLGEVVESNDSRFSPGDLVVGQLGWQEHAVARGGALRKLPPELDPPTLALHVAGATGLTAYFGLFDVGQPKPGDTVVVSGAAGAVGQIVGQLAKIAGCRTVGIAGGAEKKAELQELYGYDVAIDY
jgi:NADPH-dependent curcumin reductase